MEKTIIMAATSFPKGPLEIKYNGKPTSAAAVMLKICRFVKFPMNLGLTCLKFFGVATVIAIFSLLSERQKLI